MIQEKALSEQAWRNIGVIRSVKDEFFARQLLESRRDFLRLRARHEIALRKIYIDAAGQVARDLRNLKPTIGDLTRNHLMTLEKSLRRETEKIQKATQALTRSGMEEAVGLGARPIDNHLLRAAQDADVGLDFLKIQRGFGDINTAAVEALWARSRHGLAVSERIWSQSQTARAAMRDLVHVGVATGRDVVKVARDLERYVRQGRRTLAEDYPNMMARMNRRIPKDVCYEALRLARTEYSNAFMEGVYSRGRVNPSYQGVRWMLSDSHPESDVCDDLASADLYNMGPGVYPAGEEPVQPHIQCLCYVIPYLVETKDFIVQLKEWKNNPSRQPKIEKWYNEVYQKVFGVTGTVRQKNLLKTAGSIAGLTIRQWRYGIKQLMTTDPTKFNKALDSIKTKFQNKYNAEFELSSDLINKLRSGSEQHRKAVTELYHALNRMPIEATRDNPMFTRLVLGADTRGAMGTYNFRTGIVEIDSNAFIVSPEISKKRFSNAYDTLLHEIGHSVHYWQDKQFSSWVNNMWDLNPLRKNDFWKMSYYGRVTGSIKDYSGVTSYGMADPIEDFAESWYILYADNIKERNKLLYKLEYDGSQWKSSNVLNNRYLLLKRAIENLGWEVPQT